MDNDQPDLPSRQFDPTQLTDDDLGTLYDLMMLHRGEAKAFCNFVLTQIVHVERVRRRSNEYDEGVPASLAAYPRDWPASDVADALHFSYLLVHGTGSASLAALFDTLHLHALAAAESCLRGQRRVSEPNGHQSRLQSLWGRLTGNRR